MKKVWSLILALALLLTMVSIVPATAESADVFRYDEPITLKVSVFDRGNTGGTAADDNHWTKWIQENFGDPRNIKIEWVVIPRSEEVPKLATLMMDEASCPDICFTYTESVVTDYVNQGGVTVDGVKITDFKAVFSKDDLKDGKLVKRGKKSFKLVKY